jgi:hypothetical protein
VTTTRCCCTRSVWPPGRRPGRIRQLNEAAPAGSRQATRGRLTMGANSLIQLLAGPVPLAAHHRWQTAAHLLCLAGRLARQPGSAAVASGSLRPDRADAILRLADVDEADRDVRQARTVVS